MACRLLGVKPLPEQMLSIGHLETDFSGIRIKIAIFSIKKNAFENVVCEKAAILSRGMSQTTPGNQAQINHVGHKDRDVETQQASICA